MTVQLPVFTMRTLPKWLALAVIIVGLVGPRLAKAADFDHTHELLNRTLKAHVANSQVDYAALKAQRADLDRYLRTTASAQKNTFAAWPEPQQLAFLVNVYNATTLQLVIEHYPVTSIKKIGSWRKGPWDQAVVKLWGETLTLNHLEHKILRVRYDEPRLHFALVCAARGCPPLRSEAYVAARLDEQLDDQARQFMAEAHKNRVDASRSTVYLSPIFKWYGEDFVKKHGSVLSALRPFWPPPMADVVTEGFKVRYTRYDWALNNRNR